MRRLATLLVAMVIMTSGCGAGDMQASDTGFSRTATRSVARPSVGCGHSAAVASVDGAPTITQQKETDWALTRFAAAELGLPACITVIFDSTKQQCGGALGTCRPDLAPPKIFVCEPDGQNAFRSLNRRITLLHELGHLWYAAADVDPTTARAIVGGERSSSATSWEERTEERVAMLISWGLLDQPRRPVPLERSCGELASQFEQLTGSHPLGPLPVGCGSSMLEDERPG